MPGVVDLIEEQRKKRRTQLDKILAGGAPQQGAMNFQPVPLTPAKGSVLVGAIPIAGALAAGAHAGAAPPPTPIVSPTTAQTVPTSFEPLSASARAHPASGSPGAPPLSPLGTQPP